MRREARVLLLIGGLVGFLIALHLQTLVSLDQLRTHETELIRLYRDQPALFIGLFMAAQILALTLAIPGAVITTALLGGALFGQAWGTIIVLSSFTVGDSLAFLVARYFAKQWVLSRVGNRLDTIQQAVDRDGGYYLLGARLIPVIPYFLVNWGMALTRMPLRVFAPVSFIGLMPATFVYVNAGAHLAQIRSPSDILSARLMMALGLLGLLSIAGRIFGRMSAAKVTGNE